MINLFAHRKFASALPIEIVQYFAPNLISRFMCFDERVGSVTPFFPIPQNTINYRNELAKLIGKHCGIQLMIYHIDSVDLSDESNALSSSKGARIIGQSPIAIRC